MVVQNLKNKKVENDFVSMASFSEKPVFFLIFSKKFFT